MHTVLQYFTTIKICMCVYTCIAISRSLTVDCVDDEALQTLCSGKLHLRFFDLSHSSITDKRYLSPSPPPPPPLSLSLLFPFLVDRLCIAIIISFQPITFCVGSELTYHMLVCTCSCMYRCISRRACPRCITTLCL